MISLLKPIQRVFTGALLLSAMTSTQFAQERSSIPEELRWNLADIYPTPAAAIADRDAFAARFGEIGRFQGKLGESAVSLYQALELRMRLDQQISKLYTYASSWSDEDTRLSPPLELRQTIEQLYVKYQTAASYLRPEILSLPPEKVRSFIQEETRLQAYRPYLENILRWQPHTRSTSEEKLIALAAQMSGAGHEIRGIFANAEMPYPEIILSDGKKVRLDASGYTLHRQSPVRADRFAVFQSFWKTHQDYRRTFAAALYEQVKAHIFLKEARGFHSCLEAALFHDNIPVSVYEQLIEAVHQNLPTLHRYLELRRKILGVETLGYEDVYAPLVPAVELRYTPEEATRLVLESVRLLGPEYHDQMAEGFRNRWIDWMPSTGKRSGAYSTGVYSVHPFQLLNYNGLFDDLSTLAHEWGHSMHTFLSHRHQPYVTADYSIFVAEVASTLNENLLLYHVLEQTSDDDTRLFLLGHRLDTLRGTLFRQTLFAEFEWRIHQMVENGESLSADVLNKLYLDLLRLYMGHDQGVCRVEELYAVEWAYVPHFYYNFYVYQYATSLTASITLEQRIRGEAKAGTSTTARDSYLKMLSAGSSQYPIELLREAGVDMNTPVPFQTAMEEMNSVMMEINTILTRKEKLSR